MQKVLFVVSNNPFSKDRKTILKLLEELSKLELQLEVYLHGNGVWWLGLEDLKKLAEKGVKVYCARHSVAKRNQTVPPWATEIDIDLLVEKIVDSDKVLFFN
jgi:sulfur transfer complex TusBCD TusB component (DsrH family)